MRYLVLDDAIEGDAFGWTPDTFAGALRGPLAAIGVRVIRQQGAGSHSGKGGLQGREQLSPNAFKAKVEKSGAHSGSDDEIPIIARLKMSWEFMRDTGLMTFALGAVLFFGLSRAHSRVPELQLLNPRWIRTIGDGMMLGGACLALIAMLGQWVLSAFP